MYIAYRNDFSSSPYSILKKRSFSMIYPFSLLVLFAIADTTFEISARKTNELIVYNTPGNSTIGIRTGKILNLYSDTIQVRAEVLGSIVPHVVLK